MSDVKIVMKDSVETPWDIEIDEGSYNLAVNDPGVSVMKFQDRFFMHVVYRLTSGQEYSVPEGLARRLCDQLPYADRV